MDDQIKNKQVKNKNSKLIIGNRYMGKNEKYQEPDIVIEDLAVGAIMYVLSIKNSLSNIAPTNNEKESILVKELIKQNGVCTNSIQDIFRIDNIRHGLHQNFKSLTIVFSDTSQSHRKINDIIQHSFEWHRFIILERNDNLFIDELNETLCIINNQGN